MCWLLGSLCPILAAVFSKRDNRKSICISLGTSVHFAVSVLYICFNTIVCCTLLTVYVIIIYMLFKSFFELRIRRDYNRLRCTLRLGAIGFTNMAIFITTTTINIMSMLGMKTKDIEVVTALLLFPINAILNPLFNTILSGDFYNTVTSVVGLHVYGAMYCLYISIYNKMSVLKHQGF